MRFLTFDCKRWYLFKSEHSLRHFWDLWRNNVRCLFFPSGETSEKTSNSPLVSLLPGLNCQNTQEISSVFILPKSGAQSKSRLELNLTWVLHKHDPNASSAKRSATSVTASRGNRKGVLVQTQACLQMDLVGASWPDSMRRAGTANGRRAAQEETGSTSKPAA